MSRDHRQEPGRAAPHVKCGAVLFDRDDTLIDDVPYNGDPARVVVRPGARAALDRLRSLGIPTAMITNQSGVGRGLISLQQVGAVNQRVEELLGPLGPWFICPHRPEAACGCRKPKPGLVLQAARTLGVAVETIVVLGDKRTDVEAAHAAGARGILLRAPGGDTWGYPFADSLLEAVDLLLDPAF